jgi:hypothetical protein
VAGQRLSSLNAISLTDDGRSSTPRSRSTAEFNRREADIEIAGKSADSLRNATGNSNTRAFTWPGQARHSTFSVRRGGVDSEPVEGR